MISEVEISDLDNNKGTPFKSAFIIYKLFDLF